MLAIDMTGLGSASRGDPDGKVTVKRSWLREVHRLLENREKLEGEVQELRARLAAHEDMSGQSKGSRMDAMMDKMFGNRHADS